MKPGEFKAVCNLKKWAWERRMTAEEIRDAKAAGRPRRFVELQSERRDRETGRKGRWEIGVPSCGGFETTDKAAFEAHMLAEHGRGTVRGHSEAFALSCRRMWKPPRLAVEGKAAPQVLRRCPSCDMSAEVSTNSSELWWSEHLRGCALASPTGISVSAEDAPLPLMPAPRSDPGPGTWNPFAREVEYLAGGCDGHNHRFERHP